jgi:hypothetical protein
MGEEKKLIRILLLVLILISIMPEPALAYSRFGISPLENAFTLISELFNIRSIVENAMVREGFLKFMIFLVMFSISYSGLRRLGEHVTIFDERTAGIVSFAFSAIGTFLMPTDWLMATGGTIVAVMSSFVFLIIFGGGLYLALFRLRGSRAAHFAGLMILIILFVLILIWEQTIGIPPFSP